MALSLLAAYPAGALSLDDMINSMMGKPASPPPAAAVPPAPGTSPAPAAAPAANSPDALLEQMKNSANPNDCRLTNSCASAQQKTPAGAAVPALPAAPAVSPATAAATEAAVAPSSEKSVFSSRGQCGFVGMIFGCPEGGVKPAPNLPELNSVINNLTSLSAASNATPQGKLELIRLGNQLGRIDASVLQQQIEQLSKAESPQQVGALRQLDLPMMNVNAAKQPLKTMEAFITDAAGSGSHMEDNLRASLTLLKQLADKVNDPNAKDSLDARITNLEALVKSKAISKAARQTISPFFNENGTPIKNPRSGTPATPKQIAITVTLMSIEDGVDAGMRDQPVPAMTRRQQSSSLDDDY